MSEFQEAYNELSRRDKEAKTPFELIEDAVNAVSPRHNELNLAVRQLGRGVLRPIRSFVENTDPLLAMRIEGEELVYAYNHEDEGLSVPMAVAYFAALWPESQHVAGYKVEKQFSPPPQESRASLTKILQFHSCGEGLYTRYGEPSALVPQSTERSVITWQWAQELAPNSSSTQRKAHITLEGDVLIPATNQYYKCEDGRLLQSKILSDPHIVELPESDRTFEIELPLGVEKIIQKEGRLLAIASHNSRQWGGVPLQHLLQEYARQVDPWRALGVQLLSLPGIRSNGLHETIASQRAFEDVTDPILESTRNFIPRPFPAFNKRELFPMAAAAIERVINDPAAAIQPEARSALGVAALLKDVLPSSTPISHER